MAIKTRNRVPAKTLAALTLLIALLFGGVAATVAWANPHGQWAPKLGLDLEGGRQIVLAPVAETGQKITSDNVRQAVGIIRQRVDGSGVSEAEVTTLGQSNIVVSLPGNPSQATLDSLKKSSQLQFRAVICAYDYRQGGNSPLGAPACAIAPPATPAPTGTPSGTPTTTPTTAPTTAPTAKPTAGAAPSTSKANAALPQALRAATASPSPSATPSATPTAPTPSATAPASGTPTDQPKTTPKNASDVAWITPDLKKKFAALDCRTAKGREQSTAPKAEPMVACAEDGTEKFILGPSEVTGASITDASSGPKPGPNGQTTGEIEVTLSLNGAGSKAFDTVTSRLTPKQEGDPQKRFGVVLDGQVITAPNSNAVISDGKSSITGSFTAASGKILADQLKFGALPLSFTVQTSEQISPQLGSDQLRMGLLAGAIGLCLVVLYSLLQYRALGLVTVFSLVIAGLISYGAVTLLGWSHNFRLTMAGVTGLIVAIGITADSFIVYFERVRDEVRDGRPLRAAVQTGWARARRTIFISDGVNFLAAAILYILSESNVKAFAFTLGLTTIIDVLIVVMFTHPFLTILSGTEFFGQGHKWSGFDPVRLGAKKATYAGRGRVTIAAQRAAEGGHA